MCSHTSSIRMEPFNDRQNIFLPRAKYSTCEVFAGVRFATITAVFADFQKYNVAITRAMAQLIVIGNPLILMNDEHWFR